MDVNETFARLNHSTEIDNYYDKDKLQRPYIIIYLFLTSASSFIGVVGNLITIATFAVTTALHQTRNAFIVNLAAADLLVTGIVMPFSVYGVLAGKLYFDHRPTLCRFLATVCAPGCLASMYTICWIGCTRYYYICKFSKYHEVFSRRRTVLYILSIWAVGFFVHFPNHVGWGDSKYSIGFQLCTLDMEKLSYSFFYGCFMVAAIVTTFVFYFKIYQTVRKSRLSVKMITGEGMIADTQFLNEIKLAKTSFKIFIIFVCTWTPTAILILIGVSGSIPSPVYLYSVYMAHSNSALNFFIYYVDNDMFRKSIKTAVTKIFGKKFSTVSPVNTNSENICKSNNGILFSETTPSTKRKSSCQVRVAVNVTAPVPINYGTNKVNLGLL